MKKDKEIKISPKIFLSKEQLLKRIQDLQKERGVAQKELGKSHQDLKDLHTLSNKNIEDYNKLLKVVDDLKRAHKKMAIIASYLTSALDHCFEEGKR